MHDRLKYAWYVTRPQVSRRPWRNLGPGLSHYAGPNKLRNKISVDLNTTPLRNPWGNGVGVGDRRPTGVGVHLRDPFPICREPRFLRQDT